MIIALYGASSVGKTTLARLLKRSLGLPLRSCGDVVREAAASVGSTPEQLPDGQHKIIDNATVAWVRTQFMTGGGLVEGRFLDQVLAPVVSAVKLIEVRASPEVRAERWASRLSAPSGEGEMRRQDELDAAFRARMYNSSPAIQPSLVIDSTARTPEECAAWLESHLTL